MRADLTWASTGKIEDILDEALARVAKGGASTTQALERYPHQAAELAPLLSVAQQIHSLPRPALSPQAHRRIRQQILAESRPSRPGVYRLPWALRQPAPRWMSAALALMLVLVVLSTGTVTAAASLPGEPLYTAKDTLEHAQLLVTPDSSRPAAHLAFARRRLQEIQVLSLFEITDGVVPRALVRETQLAIEGARSLPRDERLELLSELDQFTRQEQVDLTNLLYRADPTQRESVQWALEAARAHQQMIQSLAGGLDLSQASD